MGDEGPPLAGDTASSAVPASPLEILLEVQAHDTVIDQLRHRRDSLPERTELRTIERRLSELDRHSKELQVQRDEFGSRQLALEQQIEASKTRRKELERRMFAGIVTAPRELQAMDDEVKHLARHISELEDREIEVMEQLEPLDTGLAKVESERVSFDADAARLRNDLAKQEASIDSEIAGQRTDRDSLIPGVPQDLLTRYEQLRKKLGGTGAARLVSGTCSGCHLALPAMEVDRIKKAAPDAVITCDQCGRILVR